MFIPKYIKRLVNEIEKIPGIGNRTAWRIALFLLNADKNVSKNLAAAILNAVEVKRNCKICGAFSDVDVCQICSSQVRDRSKICVVETLADLLALETASFYDGLYHILGDLISPIDNVTEENIRIKELYNRIDHNIKELIFALPINLEADATFLIIKNYVQENFNWVKVSKIAVGLPVGSNIDLIDKMTLLRSFENRVPS